MKGATVGIDVKHYITHLFQNESEPLVQAIGGFPLSLIDQIKNDISTFKSLNITPVFVFDGLPVAISTVDKPFTGHSQGAMSTNSAQKRSQAWEEYEKGRGDQAVKQFNQVGSSDLDYLQHGKRVLINYFSSNGIEFAVAPYTSHAQLVYLHNEGYIDAIYGAIDVLMYTAVEKLIVHIDTKTSSFTWLPKSQLLYNMGVNHEQFVEACILVGCEVSPKPFPLIGQQLAATGGHGNASAPIKIALSIILSPSPYATLSGFVDPAITSITYFERFQKAYAAIQYQPVFKDSGKAEPISAAEDTPSDIHEFIGQRLPDEIYFYIYHGLIGTELLDVLTSGVLVELAPLDGGVNTQYRRFLQHLHADVYPKSLSLLSQSLHRYYQHKPIKTIQWFDQPRETIINKAPQGLYHQVSLWKISESSYRNKLKDINLLNILRPFYAEEGAKQDEVDTFIESTIHKKIDGPATTTVWKPHTPEEISVNAILRALQIVGLFTQDHHLTPWGKVITKTLASIPKRFADDANFQEALTLALLLVKDGFLNSTTLNPIVPGGPEKGSSDVQAHVLLLSRVATFISLKHKPSGFAGPLSHNILAFQSLVWKEIFSYRGLIESNLISLLANGDADRLAVENEDWTQISTKLPFLRVPNAAIGVAMKSYFDKINSSNPTDAEIPDMIKTSKTELTTMFKQAVDVLNDLSSAFSLWNFVYAGVVEAETQGLVSSTVASQFKSTNDWVKPYVF